MSILYLANVGNRDVQHSETEKTIPRLSGKEWLEDYEKHRNKLDFPIIRNGLDCALANLDGKPIDVLYLFYTDQNRYALEKHRQNDTIYFAELIKRLIRDRIPEKIKSIELIRINGVPHDYDEMFDFYSVELKKINQREHIEMAFLAPAGGIPACSMNMLLHGSSVFSSKSRVVLISESPNIRPKLLNISSEIIRSHNRKAVKEMSAQYNFNGLANLLRFSANPIDQSLSKLAMYASSRLCLDFESAMQCIEQIEESRLASEPLLSELKESVRYFMQRVPVLYSKADKQVKSDHLILQKRQICEICLCAIIKYKTGQYTDCLGRIFRIQESLARWFFEYYTGYSSNISRKFTYRKDFSNFAKTKVGRDFKNHLKSKKRRHYRFEPNRIIFIKFWSYILKTKHLSSEEGYSELLDFVKMIDSLGELRNDSPIAHGFSSVTQSIIVDKYKGNLLEDLYYLPLRFRFKWNLKIYDQIVDLIYHYY